jgi:glycerol kinase
MATSNEKLVMAIDLGTTGIRAFLFHQSGDICESAYRELTQIYPQAGWVEHDPKEIWNSTIWVMQKVIQLSGISASQIVAMGLTVQRETCLLWDENGETLHNAIVWQDRRTADRCREIKKEGYQVDIYERTGLVVDSYFSATKLEWLLQFTRENRFLNGGNILAGTIDTWILWKLTGGKVHATDHTNASRTMLMNLRTQDWDQDLLDLFNIPRSILPEIRPSLGIFGYTDPKFFDIKIPITATLGDQQASLFGHGCNVSGSLKCTYGTGCSLVQFTGTEIVRSDNGLLSTVGWTQENKSPYYALEGSMFTGGASIKWLRDQLKIIKTADETEEIANKVGSNGGVYFIPAFSGLGVPHWDMTARAAFMGITAGTSREHMIRAALESIAYQVREVVTAMNNVSKSNIQLLKVDGGACVNDFLMQFQSDLLGIPIERPLNKDTTVQGAAFAAGLAVGFWDNMDSLFSSRRIDRIFEPSSNTQYAEENFMIWQQAVERTKNWMI